MKAQKIYKHYKRKVENSSVEVHKVNNFLSVLSQDILTPPFYKNFICACSALRKEWIQLARYALISKEISQQLVPAVA